MRVLLLLCAVLLLDTVCVAQEQFAPASTAFQEIDTNKDGIGSKEEFAAFFKKMGKTPDIDEVMTTIDVDSDGNITVEEFAVFYDSKSASQDTAAKANAAKPEPVAKKADLLGPPEEGTVFAMLADFYGDKKRSGKTEKDPVAKAKRLLADYTPGHLNVILKQKFGDAAPDLSTASDFKRKPKPKKARPTVHELLTEFYMDEPRCGQKIESAEKIEEKVQHVMTSYEWPELNRALKKKFGDKAPDISSGSDFKAVVMKASRSANEPSAPAPVAAAAAAAAAAVAAAAAEVSAAPEAGTMLALLAAFYGDKERSGRDPQMTEEAARQLSELGASALREEEPVAKSRKLLEDYSPVELNEKLKEKYKDKAPDLSTASDFAQEQAKRDAQKPKTVQQLVTEFYGDEGRCGQKLDKDALEKKVHHVMTSYEWPDLARALKERFGDKAPDIEKGSDYKEIVHGADFAEYTVEQMLLEFYSSKKRSGQEFEEGHVKYHVREVLQTYSLKDLHQGLQAKFKDKAPFLPNATDWDPEAGRPADQYVGEAYQKQNREQQVVAEEEDFDEL